MAAQYRSLLEKAVFAKTSCSENGCSAESAEHPPEKDHVSETMTPRQWG
jgi:hypothetical protein